MLKRHKKTVTALLIIFCCLMKLQAQPPGPTGFTAAGSFEKIILCWDDLLQTNCTYEIYWDTLPGVTTADNLINITSMHELSYVHSPLNTTNTYYYIIRGYYNSAYTLFSPEISAKPISQAYFFNGANGDGHSVNQSCMVDMSGASKTLSVGNLTAITAINSVVLYWDYVAGAASYLVEFDNGGGWTTAGTTTTLGYIHNGLTAGISYYYRVSPQGTGCPEGPCTAISAVPAPLPASTVTNGGNGDGHSYLESCMFKMDGTDIPIQVSGVTVLPSVLSNILYWNVVSGASDYLIEYNTGSGWITATTTSALSYIHTGLTGGLTYNYQITPAVSSGCPVAPSDAVASIPAPQTAPFSVAGGIGDGHSFLESCMFKMDGTAIPVSVSGVVVITSVLSNVLFWDVIPGATGYIVEYNTGGAWATAATTSSLSYIHTGLTGGITYNYQITPVLSSACTIAPSAVSSSVPAPQLATYAAGGGPGDGHATTLSCMYKMDGTNLPLSVSGLTANTSVGSIVLYWNTVPGAAGYLVEYNTGGAWATAGTTSVAGFIHSGLTAGFNYNYRVTPQGTACLEGPSLVSSAIPAPQIIIAAYGGPGDGHAMNPTNCGFGINLNGNDPVITPPGPLSACNGQSYMLQSSAALSYQWMFNGADIPNDTNQTTTVSATGIYSVRTVVGGYSGMCPAFSMPVLLINSLPLAVTPDPSGICSGSAGVSLTASGATSYTWTPATGLSATSGDVVTATPPATQVYTVTGTSGTCSNNIVTTVTVYPAPTITITPSPNPADICPGASASLAAGGASSYIWSPASGLSSTTGATVNANPLTTQVYTVTDGNGCSSANVTVSVKQAPAITVTPNPANICSGGSVALTASGAGNYSWSPAAYLNPATGDIVTANPPVNSVYVVSGTGANGCTNSENVTVNISSSLPASVSIVQNPPGSVCSGASITFTATPVNGGTPSYQWQNGGSDIINETNAAFISSSLATGDAISCVMSSDLNCASGSPASSNIINITLLPAPAAFNVTGGGAYCSGGTAADVDLSGSETGVDYQLMYAGTPVLSPVSGNGNSIYFGNQIQAGAYTVQATNTTTGCQQTMTGAANVSIYNCLPSWVSVAVNTSGATADSSAIFDISDTLSGALFPRLDNNERDALNSPDYGLIIYNTSTGKLNCFYSGNWYEINSSFVSATTGTTAINYGTVINASGAVPSNSAILDVDSKTKGVLIPRTLPGAVYGAARGSIIYNIHSNKINFFNGSNWIALSDNFVSSVSGSGSQIADGCAVNLNNAGAAPSAILDVAAQNKAVLIPRLTNAQRDNISPVNGLMIYNVSSDQIEYFNGSAWYRMQ